MASQGVKRITMTKSNRHDNEGIISRVSTTVSESSIVYHGKRAASDAAYVTKRLLKSTGKAAWIAGTTFIILALPLIIEMDREQQLNEIEFQQASLLGTPPLSAAPHNGMKRRQWHVPRRDKGVLGQERGRV